MYRVGLSNEANRDVAFLLASGQKKLVKKISDFISELEEHPKTGTGKPEHLKHYFPKMRYSRRISDAHRLVYDIDEDAKTVVVIAARGHYQ